MNQNTKVVIAGIAAAVIALLAGLGYQHIYSQSNSLSTQTDEIKEADLTQPVAQYLSLLGESGPPNINQEAIEQMVNLLSAEAKSELLEPYSRGLAMFAGIQDLPDQGTSIVGVNKLSENAAEVSTVWNYSGAPSVKTFVMVLEAGSWKITQIK